MADTGTDFINFLKANHPDDYSKLSNDNVANSLINAIINKHQSQFEIWKKVPERIRDEYNGRVPHDILEAAKTDNNLTIDECRQIEAERTENDIHSPNMYSNDNFPIAAPSSLLAHVAFKNMIFTAAEQQKIRKKAKEIKDLGYSSKAAAQRAIIEQAEAKAKKDHENGILSDEEYIKAKHNAGRKKCDIAYQDILENQPERALCKFVMKELIQKKITDEEFLQKVAELTKKIKESGREELLAKNLNHACYASTFKKLNENQLNILVEECLSKVSNVDFASLHESTPDNATYKDSILNKLAFEYLKDQENVSNRQVENNVISSAKQTQDNNTSLYSKNQNTEDQAPLSVTNDLDQRRRFVKQEWIDNQPEKMLAHIAKNLNRGKIDKETALPQMDVLMKKVKTMGREQELETYLKQPASGYDKLNDDNKILFNELMLSHDVGAVAQTLNKVRTKTTKEAETHEQKPQQNQVVTPTKDIPLAQLKQMNKQER